MEKIRIESIAKLRPGEKMVAGSVSLRRAGILWVGHYGDERRSFEKASAAAEWFESKTAVEVATHGKKVKEVTLLSKSAGGKDVQKTVQVLDKKEIKTLKKQEKARDKKAKKKNRQMKQQVEEAKKEQLAAQPRKVNKLRRVFDVLVYTISWLFVMGVGFLSFGLFDKLIKNEALMEVKQFLFEWVEKLSPEVVIAAGATLTVATIAIFLGSAIVSMLHRTKKVKVFSSLLSIISIAGMTYVAVTGFAPFIESVKSLATIDWKTLEIIKPVTQVGTVGLLVGQVIITLSLLFIKPQNTK